MSADGTRLTVRSEVTVEEIKDAVMSLLGGLPALFSGGVLGGQGEQDSQFRREVAPVPAVREGTPAPVRVIRAAPLPGSPRFIVIARYEVLADPSAEQLDETSHMILLGLEQMGITGGTSVTQDGVFEVEMRDVNLERAMFLLGSLASDGLPLPLELIDARAERIKVEGER